MLEKDLNEIALRLIPDIESNNILIEPITGGGNNRIFKITTPSGKYVLKLYFRHKEDQRKRLESEYLFTSFAWCHGIRCIAEPIAEDHELLIGIYRFIEGEKYQPGDIGDKEISQASRFLTNINQYKSSPNAIGLSVASEACFSIEEHIKSVDLRIERLKAIEVGDDIDNEALEFVNRELAVVWSDIKAAIISKAGMNNTALTERISPEDTIISPSDFGFHNAISGNDGLIRFIDFEYAGWDDPAKTVCDFFSQVAIPIPISYFEKFVEDVLVCIINVEETLFRIKLLLPLYRIKWCCIVLNHFLSLERERKLFALQDAANEKYGQLNKARTLLSSINEMEL